MQSMRPELSLGITSRRRRMEVSLLLLEEGVAQLTRGRLLFLKRLST